MGWLAHQRNVHPVILSTWTPHYPWNAKVVCSWRITLRTDLSAWLLRWSSFSPALFVSPFTRKCLMQFLMWKAKSRLLDSALTLGLRWWYCTMYSVLHISLLCSAFLLFLRIHFNQLVYIKFKMLSWYSFYILHISRDPVLNGAVHSLRHLSNQPAILGNFGRRKTSACFKCLKPYWCCDPFVHTMTPVASEFWYKSKTMKKKMSEIQ